MEIIRRDYLDDSALSGCVSDAVLRQILFRRGVRSPEDLNGSLSGLLRPDALKDIDKASGIIASAIMSRRKIMIAGDYDIDGMSGTALGVRCLRAFGLPDECVFYYVPSRYDDGYGLGRKSVDFALSNGVDLIVTVDNGIAAFDGVDYANSKNIEVVVTDHHEIQDALPNAAAVVDPKRPDDPFESKNLCGVGVLFYVMIAVRAELLRRGYYKDRALMPNLARFLDLVTLGTIGDVMSLDCNNRRLVRAGLRQIREMRCSSGLQALIRYLRLDLAKINVRSIAFDFCPRFNAATRIKIDHNPAIATLLTDDPKEAEQLVEQLDLCNRRRTDHGSIMLAEARRVLDCELRGLCDLDTEDLLREAEKTDLFAEADDADADDAYAEGADAGSADGIYGVSMFEPLFLTGMVGLVANRLKEKYHKACMIFGADVGAGSDECARLLKNHAQEQDRPEVMSMAPVLRRERERYMRGDCEEIIVGSARSVEGLDIMRVFNHIKAEDPDIFIACGGHAMAAGASIRAKDFPRFKRLFNEGCRKCMSDMPQREGIAVSDGELPLTHLCLAFARELENLGPWGKGFEEPKFDGVFIMESAQIMGSRHVRFRLRTTNNLLVLDGIRFRASAAEKSLSELGGRDLQVRVLYTMSIDRFRQERLQLNIEAIEPV